MPKEIIEVAKLKKIRPPPGLNTTAFRTAASDEQDDRYVNDVFTLSGDPEVLEEQCNFLGIPFDKARYLTPRDCRVALDTLIRIVVRKAKTAGELDLFAAAERHMEEFPGLTKTNSAEIKKRIELFRTGKRVDDPLESSQGQQIAPNGEEVKLYFEGGEEDIPQPKKLRRDGVTVGRIKEIATPPMMTNEDLVGDRPPKNLVDLYHRWPIADNPQYFIRIERTKPKAYQGINTAGLVAEIRGRPVTEAEIQQLYGGSEYELTLYGPDPRSQGKEDTGEIRIKALTEPFKLVVPIYPPNLFALPGTEQFMQTPLNNLQPFGTAQRPTTPSDAAIHKTEKQHEQYMLDKQEKQQAEENKAASSFFGIFAKQNEAQLAYEREQLRRKEDESARKEKLYEDRIAAEKARREKQEEDLRRTKEDSTHSMFKMIKELGPDRDGEIRRMVETHQLQISTLRAAFEDQIKAMRDRHDSDLRRSDERLKDLESQYRLLIEQDRSSHQRTLEEERRSWDKRERDLREQFDKLMISQEKQHVQRVEDMKERHQTEVKGLERSQTQMMGIIKESFDTKLAVSDQTHQMLLKQAEDRFNDIQEESRRLREEAAELKDLPTMLEKARASAEALGYSKSDADAPKDWKDRAVSMLGSGITQFLSSADSWMPQVIEQRQQKQVVMAQLAASNQQQQQQQQQERIRLQHQQQQQAMAAQQRRAAQAAAAPFAGPPATPATETPGNAPMKRTSGAQWASEGQSAPRPVELPSQPLVGFQEATKAQTATTDPPSTEISAIKPAPVASDEEIQVPAKFVEAFTYEGAIQFLFAAEQQIKNRQEPAGFAALFTSKYRMAAEKLVQNFTPEEVVSAVKGIDGLEMSPILTRAGQKWLQELWRDLEQEVKQ